ncbi:MAG: hypothetical protein CMH54_04640 [Myxococcales bacterium]|nr:hypothetical protein [Myxococcales bacterium]|tara:strand:- start:1237 stop:2430 length:1194 start_codon:yes stop_codon:yes gene_type:complete
MKTIGLILVILGVGLSAAMGSRNSDTQLDRHAIAGEAALRGGATGKAFDAYCGALKDAKLPPSNGCPVDDDGEKAKEKKLTTAEKAAAFRTKLLKDGDALMADIAAMRASGCMPGDASSETLTTYEAALKDLHAEKDTIKAVYQGEKSVNSWLNAEYSKCRYEHALSAGTAAFGKTLKQDNICSAETVRGDGEPDAVFAARVNWVKEKCAHIKAQALATALPPGPSPNARVSNWLGFAGVPFVLGLLLVIGGAILYRKAVRAELVGSESGDGKGDGPTDFGVALGELATTVRDLATRAGAMDEPDDAQRESAKEEIESALQDRIAPLVEARARVQLRYGMDGFAAVFGPLATGERRLNRSWSALVDNHWPETQTSLSGAADALEYTVSTFQDLSPVS